MKAEIVEIKVAAFDYMRYLSQLREEDLRHTGHKSIEAGMAYAYRDAQNKINKLHAAHLKKYPDK